MSSTTSLNNNYYNLERITPYTIEDFNKLLEENKPYSKSTFKEITPSKIDTFKDTLLDYNRDIKLLIYSKCSTTLNNNIIYIIKYFKVSIYSNFYKESKLILYYRNILVKKIK